MKFGLFSMSVQTVFIGSSIAIMVSAFIAGSLAKQRQTRGQTDKEDCSDEPKSADHPPRKSVNKASHVNKTLNQSLAQTKKKTFLSENFDDDEFSISEDQEDDDLPVQKSKIRRLATKRKHPEIVYYSDNDRGAKFKNRLSGRAALEDEKMDDLYFAVFKKLAS